MVEFCLLMNSLLPFRQFRLIGLMVYIMFFSQTQDPLQSLKKQTKQSQTIKTDKNRQINNDSAGGVCGVERSSDAI